MFLLHLSCGKAAAATSLDKKQYCIILTYFHNSNTTNMIAINILTIT